MAIYHLSIKIISRSKGKSSVGASAYRSGEKLYNKRDGLEHDYRRKKDIVYKEILAPNNAPNWAIDRERLWNEVENIEKSKNSQLAREIDVALPIELSLENQIDLLRNYVQETFINDGMIADFVIHDKKDGNPHAHIMLTMRPFNENGEWGAKAKKEYILDKQGKKIYDKKGNAKSRKIETTNWNKKETLEHWREQWALHTNRALEKENIKGRIDHRSYEERGINKIASRHEGHIVRAMKNRGEETEIGAINDKIKVENYKLELLDRQIKSYQEMRGIQLERIKGNGARNGNSGFEERNYDISEPKGEESGRNRTKESKDKELKRYIEEQRERDRILEERIKKEQEIQRSRAAKSKRVPKRIDRGMEL